MSYIFLLLFLVSTIALIIGLAKPSIFSRFLKARATRKNIAVIFGIASITSFFLIGVTAKTNTPEKMQENQVTQQTASQDEKKFGFTEEERRQILKEIVAAEDRANDEAEEMYPIDSSNPALWNGNTWLQDKFEENMERNIKHSNELMEVYRAQVRTKYGISEEIQRNITREGIEKNWPLD